MIGRDSLLGHFVQDVPIEQLRHDIKPVHVAEGYGGKPIELFPPYRFFQLHENRANEAQELFRAWYHEQFHKYSGVPKDVGGMRNGSLYRLVAAEHRRHGFTVSGEKPTFQKQLVERAIARRVEQRLDLLAAIKDGGYDPERADTIVGVSGPGDVIYLTGGHHRAAVLRAIGESVLPGVVVLSPVTRYVFKKLRIA